MGTLAIALIVLAVLVVLGIVLERVKVVNGVVALLVLAVIYWAVGR